MEDYKLISGFIICVFVLIYILLNKYVKCSRFAVCKIVHQFKEYAPLSVCTGNVFQNQPQNS